LIAAGQSIGNYRILSKIGTGGMGAVYLAEHPLIGKKVALKVIHRELSGNREVVQRFFQEARAVNQIGNEHIVEIHDFGVTPENDHFYIMEYLEGHTLAAVLSREKVLPVMRALHVGAQIASALHAAHTAGVIHRDLKPDNIMLVAKLGDPDFVKVLDFGLAKIFAQGPSAVQTAAGVLLGTPQYMSPEACESRGGVDHRTDVYALGVLLFQMMCGKLPFDGESMGEILVKQVTALPPAPRGLNPMVPPSVEQVLLRCLAKPVGARFQTMGELRDALLDPEAYLHTSPPIAPARSVAPGEAKFDAKTVMAAVAAKRSSEVPATILADGMAPLPMLAPPTEPKNHTMRIATPIGYSSRQPRKMWPIVLVLGLLLGLTGGAFAVAWFGRGEPVASAVDAAPADAKTVVVVTPIDAAVARTVASDAAASAASDAAGAPSDDAGTGNPPAGTAKLTIRSTPSKASVYGPDGTLLGKTDFELDWAISDQPVTFEVRLPGYRKKRKELTVTGNTVVVLELERLPRPGLGSGRPPGKGSSDLIRPGD
jgi:serine/threonine protein kinase